MHIFDTKISVFQNIPYQNGTYNFVYHENTTICNFIAHCFNGAWLSKLFEDIRSEKDEDKQKQLKSFLPAFTISAQYAGKRIRENLISYSRLICLDIDQKGNNVEDWPQLRDLFFESFPEVLMSALSARGNGLFLIVRLEDCATPETHKQYFQALYNIFHKKLNVTLDKSCSDVGRLRFMTCDPDLKYRGKKSEPFRLPITPKKHFAKYRQSRKMHSSGLFKKALDFAVARYGSFEKGNRHMVISSITTTLAKAGLSVSERERLIHENLIGPGEIRSNCINKTL